MLSQVRSTWTFFPFSFHLFVFAHGCVFFNGRVKLKVPLFKLVGQKGFCWYFALGFGVSCVGLRALAGHCLKWADAKKPCSVLYRVAN